MTTKLKVDLAIVKNELIELLKVNQYSYSRMSLVFCCDGDVFSLGKCCFVIKILLLKYF